MGQRNVGGEISQGQSVTFTVQVDGVAGSAVAGTVETYTLSGSAVTSGQVTSPGSGTVTLDDNGMATVTVNTAADVFSSSAGQDTLTFTLNTGGTPATDMVSVNNGTVHVSNPEVEAGQPGYLHDRHRKSAYFDGRNLYADRRRCEPDQSGPAVRDRDDHGRHATLVIPTGATLFNQPDGATESLTLTLGGPTGGTATATIDEDATISVSPPASAVDEGDSVTFELCGKFQRACRHGGFLYAVRRRDWQRSCQRPDRHGDGPTGRMGGDHGPDAGQ